MRYDFRPVKNERSFKSHDGITGFIIKIFEGKLKNKRVIN
jgi:hypothetical protein